MTGSTNKSTDKPLVVPTSHGRRSHYFRIIDRPVIEKGKWAIAAFDVISIGKVTGYCVIEYTYEEGYGYREGDYTFLTTREEATACALDLVREKGAQSEED